MRADDPEQTIIDPLPGKAGGDLEFRSSCKERRKSRLDERHALSHGIQIATVRDLPLLGLGLDLNDLSTNLANGKIEVWTLELDERRTRGDHGSRWGEEVRDDSGGFRDHIDLIQRLQDTWCSDSSWCGPERKYRQGGAQDEKSYGYSSGPATGEARARDHVGEAFPKRDDEPRDDTGDYQDEADDQKFVSDEGNDGDKKDESVTHAGNTIHGEPEGLESGKSRALGILISEQIEFDDVDQLLARTSLEIRNIEDVRDNVVAVKAHERIHVEENRRNRGYPHYIVRYGVNGSFAGAGPNDGGE